MGRSSAALDREASDDGAQCCHYLRDSALFGLESRILFLERAQEFASHFAKVTHQSNRSAEHCSPSIPGLTRDLDNCGAWNGLVRYGWCILNGRNDVDHITGAGTTFMSCDVSRGGTPRNSFNSTFYQLADIGLADSLSGIDEYDIRGFRNMKRHDRRQSITASAD